MCRHTLRSVLLTAVCFAVLTPVALQSLPVSSGAALELQCTTLQQISARVEPIKYSVCVFMLHASTRRHSGSLPGEGRGGGGGGGGKVRGGGGGGAGGGARGQCESRYRHTLSLDGLSSLEVGIGRARHHSQLLSLHHIQTPSPALVNQLLLRKDKDVGRCGDGGGEGQGLGFI